MCSQSDYYHCNGHFHVFTSVSVPLALPRVCVCVCVRACFCVCVNVSSACDYVWACGCVFCTCVFLICDMGFSEYVHTSLLSLSTHVFAVCSKQILGEKINKSIKAHSKY